MAGVRLARMMRRRDSALSLQRVYSLLVRYSRTPCLTATQLAGQRSKLLRVSDNGLAIPILIGAVGFIHLYLSQVRFESQFDLDLLWNFGFVHLYPSQVPFKSRFDLAHVEPRDSKAGVTNSVRRRQATQSLGHYVLLQKCPASRLS